MIYAFRKEIDWSLFNWGMAIPNDVGQVLRLSGKLDLERGQRKPITLIIGPNEYPALLYNQKIDESKYHNHVDKLQIRFNPGSKIALALRELFNPIYRYLLSEKGFPEYDKKRISIPLNLQSFLQISVSDGSDRFLIEPEGVPSVQVANDLIRYDEYEFEQTGYLELHDSDAHIKTRTALKKIRVYDISIGDRLKNIYDYRCQICGENFGTPYSIHAVETHHIEPFTRSLNNNGDNQMIICPNHHHVIHVSNAFFNRGRMAYEYPNGLVESLKLNVHLNNRIQL